MFACFDSLFRVKYALTLTFTSRAKSWCEDGCNAQGTSIEVSSFIPDHSCKLSSHRHYGGDGPSHLTTAEGWRLSEKVAPWASRYGRRSFPRLGQRTCGTPFLTGSRLDFARGIRFI